MDNKQLGQRIADEVVARFGKVNVKSGKPCVRSNGVSEWTVLAGLVAIQDDDITVLTLATGVKAMPDSIRSYSKGSIVHDMHAEILCLRMFNWYVMEEIKCPEKRRFLRPIEANNCNNSGASGPEHTHKDNPQGFHDKDQTRSNPTTLRPEVGSLEQAEDSSKAQFLDPLVPGVENDASKDCQKLSNPRFEWSPAVKLALYISEPPCGDASMSHISQGETAWNTDAKDKSVTKRQKIVRGRAGFDNVGIVRTKPGRADSRVSYSKSCSDKLCVKQYTGILNCITSFCVEPIYLDYLVLDEKKHVHADFARCFEERLPIKSPHLLRALTFVENKWRFSKEAGRVTSPVSLVYCAITKTAHVLNQGVKNGAYVKNKPPKATGESLICRRKLWEQAKGEIADFDSYQQLKSSCSGREDQKKMARSILGSWPSCSKDDFCL